ncbi:hypothetical protein [Paenibacillus donghaensis]|uniref:hypothetical protein n=1 Tax=Paenibacillus donghaensis TaxID=414771 RepID=UPI0012FD68B4|nr:hypothetical protein [Paenibacillus donghaensis]
MIKTKNINKEQKDILYRAYNQIEGVYQQLSVEYKEDGYIAEALDCLLEAIKQ